MSSGKRFLFICGCARSGTTAFTHLFTAHRRIVLGMERYGRLARPDNFALSPAHFDKQRFLNVQPGDTFYDDFESFHRFDTQIEEKYSDCIYTGDKCPDLYLAYDQLFAAFPECTVFFIYRDLIDVASSYQARCEAGRNWPSHRNYQAAISDWNRSLRLTLKAIESGYRVLPVGYLDVFSSEHPLDTIFAALNIDMPPNVHKRISGLRRRAGELDDIRKSYLNAAQIEEVRQSMDAAALAKLKKLNILNQA